jgi:hypothetical protein
MIINGMNLPAYAAESGHGNVLELVVGNGCPYDSSVLQSATNGGHIHILQMARIFDFYGEEKDYYQ